MLVYNRLSDVGCIIFLRSRTCWQQYRNKIYQYLVSKMKRAPIVHTPLTLFILLLLLLPTVSTLDGFQKDRGSLHDAAKHNPQEDREELDQLVEERCKSCKQKDQTIDQLKAEVSTLKLINKNLEAQLEKYKQTSLDHTNIQIAHLKQENQLLQAKLQEQSKSLLKIQNQLRTAKIRLDQQSAKFQQQQTRLIHITNQLSNTQLNLQKQTAKFQQQSLRLVQVQNQLQTTKIKLQQQIAKKDCAQCPQIHCPTITCPEHKQCKCQPCQKPSPCPQPACPPQTVCPKPKPCNCEICKQPVVCPEVECPEAQPCPISSCQSQLSQIANLKSQKQTLQLALSQASRQRDDCLKEDPHKLKQQQLTKIKSQISVQLTQILAQIESGLFSTSQKFNFQTIKALSDQIRGYLNNQSQVGWFESLVYYRRILTQLIEELQNTSSLTADAIQLNHKYSSGLKSLRDRLASCESILR